MTFIPASRRGAFCHAFRKPIESELVLDLDLLSLSHKNETHMDNLYLLTRESIIKSGLDAYHDQIEATNKFYLGAIILSDIVLVTIKRELRRLSPDVKIQIEELSNILKQDVIKREVIEGDKAESARKKLKKSSDKILRAKKQVSNEDAPSEGEAKSEQQVES